MMMEVILTEEQRKMYNVAAHVWYIFLFVFLWSDFIFSFLWQ